MWLADHANTNKMTTLTTCADETQIFLYIVRHVIHNFLKLKKSLLNNELKKKY